MFEIIATGAQFWQHLLLTSNITNGRSLFFDATGCLSILFLVGSSMGAQLSYYIGGWTDDKCNVTEIRVEYKPVGELFGPAPSDLPHPFGVCVRTDSCSERRGNKDVPDVQRHQNSRFYNMGNL